MRTYYYCLMDIPNHPLRVKGLAYLQQKSNQPKLEVCTCPKCGIQLYRPKDAVSMKCTCGFVFSIQEYHCLLKKHHKVTLFYNSPTIRLSTSSKNSLILFTISFITLGSNRICLSCTF